MKRILAGLTAVSTTAIIAVSGGVAAAQSSGPTSKWCNDHSYSSSQLCYKAWKKSQHQTPTTPTTPTPGSGGSSGGGTSSNNVDASEHTNQTASPKGNTGAVSHGYGGGHNTTSTSLQLTLNNSYNNIINFVINVFN
jgi:hypothetical protein